MKRTVKFAILKYVPNEERDEKINVAVVLHSPQDEFMETRIIENWKRLKNFDDEIDIEFMKAYLKSIQSEFQYKFLDKETKNIKDKMLLDNMAKIYVNQFLFSISEVYIEDTCEEFLTKLKNNYLYYDIEKDKRPSSKESLNFFRDLLKAKNISYEIINFKNSLIGSFDEKINVDLKINDTYYKIITFNDNNIDTYMPKIKMWMLNAIELTEKKEKLIFIINEQETNSKTKKFIEMLGKYAEIIKITDFNDYF